MTGNDVSEEYSLISDAVIEHPKYPAPIIFKEGVSDDDPNYLLKCLTLYPAKPKVPAWLKN
jgi:hypothetical protein